MLHVMILEGRNHLRNFQDMKDASFTIDGDSETRVPARLHQFDVENAARRVVDHHVELQFQFHPVRVARNILLVLEGCRRVAHDLSDELNVEVVQFVDRHDAIAFLDATRAIADGVLDDLRDEKSAAGL